NNLQLHRSEMSPSSKANIPLLLSAGNNLDSRFHKHSVPTGLKSNHARNLKLETRSSKPPTATTRASLTPFAPPPTTVNANIGTLPAGKSVTITFQVTLNTAMPQGTN